MRVLVCGGRDFKDWGLLCNELDSLHVTCKFADLIQGGANGADRMAKEWARLRGVPVIEEKADWKTHGRAAGPIRNRKMLEHKPDLVVAFPGGSGTADMMRAADSANVRVIDIARQIRHGREEWIRERRAIMELDGGLTRAEAEQQAVECYERTYGGTE